MIRGAGRLQRTDTRAQFFTPGEDCVRDGRHLMPQEEPSFAALVALQREKDGLEATLAAHLRAWTTARIHLPDDTDCRWYCDFCRAVGNSNRAAVPTCPTCCVPMRLWHVNTDAEARRLMGCA